MILEVRNISKLFHIEAGAWKQKAGLRKALDNVSFTVNEHETVGIVGESGCGKTTLAKIVLKLIPPSSGEIIFDTEKITRFRKDVQIIFQNPYSSLNPKMHVLDIVAEPLFIHKITSTAKETETRVIDLLRTVDMDESAAKRYPWEFSGGQRQRICIARALACEPKFLVLDEPISSLDLTIQAQMLDLFRALKRRLKLTYLFISHNLAVIKHIADTVIVMQEGRIVESGPCEKLFNSPRELYTQLLLDAAKG
jgi:ABC-type microcin C transport system duplicated ATPase subunit YejF